MNFSQVKGNREVVRTLVSMVDSGRIPHAVMFHEEDGGEAFPLCLALLSYLYCRRRAHSDSCSQCPSCNRIDKLIHPDVHFIFPTASSALTGQYMAQLRGLVSEKLPFTEDDVCSAFGIERKRQIIAVGEARHLLDSLSVTALEGGYRSVVIYLPEKMNAEAANRLLKIVEEPPQLTLFLMITHHPEQVLQTISSRCLHIQVERAGTVSEKLPSGPVIVPFIVGASLTTIVAPIRGFPCSSETVPVMVRSGSWRSAAVSGSSEIPSAHTAPGMPHNRSRTRNTRLLTRVRSNFSIDSI